VSLSKRPAAKRKQLDNLKPAPAPERGNRRAVKHGATAKPPADRVAAIEDELLAALPIRDPRSGEAPSHDRAMVNLAAIALARLESVTAYIEEHGPLTRGGRMREASRYEMELSTRAANLLDRLGMSPVSRAKLGVDLVKARDLAKEMSALDVPDADVVDEPSTEPVYDADAEEWDEE
jgi:hypothetical protein